MNKNYLFGIYNCCGDSVEISGCIINNEYLMRYLYQKIMQLNSLVEGGKQPKSIQEFYQKIIKEIEAKYQGDIREELKRILKECYDSIITKITKHSRR